MDPFSFFIGNQILARLFGEGWEKVKKYCKPDQLKKAIEHELSSNVELKKLIEPSPILQVDHLNQPTCRNLASFVFRGNHEDLALFDCEEQIVILPNKPVEVVEDYDAVWICIAHCVNQAFIKSVEEDADYQRFYVPTAFAELNSQIVQMKDALDKNSLNSNLMAADIKSVFAKCEEMFNSPLKNPHVLTKFRFVYFSLLSSSQGYSDESGTTEISTAAGTVCSYSGVAENSSECVLRTLKPVSGRA